MEKLAMFNYIWPLGLVVLSNVFYQICAKSVPLGMNPLASLTVTYAVGAVVSLFLYYMLNKDANILKEYGKLNWAPVILGISIVGLEVDPTNPGSYNSMMYQNAVLKSDESFVKFRGLWYDFADIASAVKTRGGECLHNDLDNFTIKAVLTKNL